MKKIWNKKSQAEIKEKIFEALAKNVNYLDQMTFGIPASYLDDKVFNQDASFLKDAPYMSTLVKNPNHIGCHTVGPSEPFFEGTQAIERELIEICAIDILQGEPGQQDGYIASGGTEANMQAIWIYRNYYMRHLKACVDEIAILCSADSHYSMDKAANILCLDIFKIGVTEDTRAMTETGIVEKIIEAKNRGKKYFIVVCNMMTTMFGSVDDIELLVKCLNELTCEFKIHVDGAYGGFYYPFSNSENSLSFKNKYITSFTLDAHKMAQAPYGTGIFIIRKSWIQYTRTMEASYVKGEDCTLIGSRSGANAVAVWMILSKYGPYGWNEKVFILQKRTDWFCKHLDELNVEYYRNPFANIIAIRAKFLKLDISRKFGLVPDNHHLPKWYKVVIMDHVTIEKLEVLISEISRFVQSKQIEQLSS